jgi:hypothetical protein
MRVYHGIDAWYRGYAPRHQTFQPDLHDSHHVEDIVQLTLESDGVWRAVPSSSSRHHEAQAAPESRGRQDSPLFPSSLRAYSSQGLARDLAQVKGQRLDMYV